MKKIIYILLVLVYCVASCKNTPTMSDKKTKQEEVSLDMSTDSIKTNAISPVLFKELEKLISHNDSVSTNEELKTNIYIIYFSTEGNTCFLTMSTAHFYDNTYLSGYVQIDDKMIAFYNPESICNKGLIDITKLEKESPKNFPDENSDIAIHTIYDPWGMKYIIHSKDSLELIYSGGL